MYKYLPDIKRRILHIKFLEKLAGRLLPAARLPPQACGIFYLQAPLPPVFKGPRILSESSILVIG